MLLNATHEITHCGLPEHIQERYIRYKQGNRAIVAWMTKFGPEQYKGKKTLPIKQLVSLGHNLCERIEEIGTLPGSVDHYFNEVIKERTYLSQHFRDCRDLGVKDEISTVNHEHFTKSLKEIHRILLGAGKPAQNPSARLRKHTRRESDMSITSDTVNRFNRLCVDEISDDDAASDTSSVDTDITSECSHEALEGEHSCCKDSEASEDFLAVEGVIATALEASLFLHRVQILINSVKACWAEVGKSRLPLLAATSTTNVICGKLIQCEQAYRHSLDGELSPKLLESKLSQIQVISRHTMSNSHDQSPCLLNILNEMFEIINTDNLSKEACGHSQLPRKMFCGDQQNSTNGHTEFTGLIMSNIAHLLSANGHPNICYQSLPHLSVFRDLVVGRTTTTNHFRAALVLLVQYTGCMAYMDVLQQPARLAFPRIMSLKLASHAASSIDKFLEDKTIFPCQCINTLGYRMAETRSRLEAFAKYNCWNLLMQSPIIAGNQALEILDLCSYYGMHLFHYRQYVGAVLHTYNVLIQIGGLERTPILEDFCGLFQGVLFSNGARPTSNFMSTWMRYIGARLRFRKGNRSQNHRDTWCMSIPPHEASRAAGLNIDNKDQAPIESKFDYGTIDLVTRLKRRDWNIDKDSSGDICGGSSCNSHSRSHRGSVRRRASSTRSCESVHEIQLTSDLNPSRPSSMNNSNVSQLEVDDSICSHLLPTLTSSLTTNLEASPARHLPTARINLFAVFHSMCRIVSSISNATHNPETDQTGQPVHMCLCFVQTILHAADRIIDTRKKTSRMDVKGSCWSKSERECVDCLKNAIVAEMETVGRVDGREWLFDI